MVGWAVLLITCKRVKGTLFVPTKKQRSTYYQIFLLFCLLSKQKVKLRPLYYTTNRKKEFAQNNYLIYFYEEDGGNPVTVDLGVKAFFGYKAGSGKIPGTAGAHVEANALISFSIRARDDKMGVIEINHNEFLGFKYKIPTPKGSAYCYIS